MAPYQKTNAFARSPSLALRRSSLRSRGPAEPKLQSSETAPVVALRAMPGTLHSIVLRGCATRSQRRSVVGLGRLELPTSRLSSARSNQLSYKPLTLIPKRETGTCSRAAGFTPDGQHKRSPWRVFVREERETKTAKSRQWSSTILKLLAPDVSEEVR